MITMKWLHLSDIHFARFGFKTEKLRSALIEKLEVLSPELSFILITGDCFYKNKLNPDTISELRNFIIKLSKACNIDKHRVYLCQGNHDLYRYDEVRNHFIDEARQGKNAFEYSTVLTGDSNESFRYLYKSIHGKEYVDYAVHEFKKHNARIISINSCLFSKDDDDYQKLHVCTSELEKLRKNIKDDKKLNILIMHHGIDYLDPKDARSFEHWVEDNSIDVLFVGHTHQPKVTLLNDVNREIMQFTSGALIVDGYAVPSFFLCEYDGCKLSLSLYSFSKETESWLLDNHSLRKFRNDGKYSICLPRKINGIIEREGLSPEDLIASLNEKYEAKYRSKRFFSEKTGEYEDFNAWKIVNSLSGVGVPYHVAIRLTETVVDKLTSSDYDANDLPKSRLIKNVIYDALITCNDTYRELQEFDIGLWASAYARHYDKSVGFSYIKDNQEEFISYKILKSSILENVVNRVTGDEVYFKKISTKELDDMASEIMKFLKSLGISKMRYDVLLSVIEEYITEPPHPWFISNNRDELLEYHKEHLMQHLEELSRGTEGNPILQIEIAYHLFAAFLTIYDKFVGCTEVSPIIILRNSLKRINTKSNDTLPMRRCSLVQLVGDLRKRGISLENFIKNVDIIFHNIVEEKTVSKHDTVDAFLELRKTLSLLEQPREEKWAKTNNTFNDVFDLFRNAIGFTIEESPDRFKEKVFCVKPHWDDHQRKNCKLSDAEVLVCMLGDSGVSLEDICKYLAEKRKFIISEVVFFKKDVEAFSFEEREAIREALKHSNINVLCIFIQEQNFQYVQTNGWRNEFFKVIKISRNSIL